MSDNQSSFFCKCNRD